MSEMYHDRGDSEIPWKPPVIAAILGALAVAAFVIYAIVSGPVDEPGSDDLFVPPAPSKDAPAGYTLLRSDSDVGVRVESVTRGGGSSIVVVSSAVEGTTDPTDSPPPDVAYWEMGPDGARVMMDVQIASDDAAGTTTILFPGETISSGSIIVAHPMEAVASAGTEIEVAPTMIGEPIAFVVDIEPGIAITGRVTVGDGWGTVEWTAPDGLVATLDIEATFVGTENPAADMSEPIRLVPAYDPALARPGTIIIPKPLYGFGGSYALYGDGRSLTEGGEATAIVVGLEGTVVTETAEPVILDPPLDEG